MHSTRQTRWRAGLAGVLIAGLSGMAAMAQSGGVEIKDAWARATPGGAENGAAYLTLVSPTGDRLVAVSTPAAGKAELHTISMDNGIMRMRPLDGIDLPPGQPVTLKPGGMHLMMMGLKQPLIAGASFPLTLSFEKAGKRQVTVAVGSPGAMGPAAALPAEGGQTGTGMPMPAHR